MTTKKTIEEIICGVCVSCNCDWRNCNRLQKAKADISVLVGEIMGEDFCCGHQDCGECLLEKFERRGDCLDIEASVNKTKYEQRQRAKERGVEL